MEKEIKKKKIKTAAVISAVLVCLVAISSGPSLMAEDTQVAGDSDVSGAGSENVFTGPVNVTLIAQDDLSGVNTTFYAVNPSTTPIPPEELNIYVDTFTISEPGAYEIHYFSVDNAGNVEDVKVTVFKIVEEDVTPPETTCILEGMI